MIAASSTTLSPPFGHDYVDLRSSVMPFSRRAPTSIVQRAVTRSACVPSMQGTVLPHPEFDLASHPASKTGI
jgi:hypothetical protein